MKIQPGAEKAPRRRKTVKIAILIDRPDNSDSLARAIAQVANLVGAERVEHVAEADVVVTDGVRSLEGVFSKFPLKQFVIMVMPGNKVGKLPENVHAFGINNFVMCLLEVLTKVAKEKGAPEEMPFVRPAAPAGAPRVLVIDDTPSNIQSAMETVPTGYELVTATGYDEGMELLGKGHFDVVLTDLHMPMSSQTLSTEAFHLGELVPYGLLVVMEALRHGVEEIAVVTDLNHHADCFSAAFDHFTRCEAIKTGRTRIRLLHAPLRPDGTKDWGKVLD